MIKIIDKYLVCKIWLHTIAIIYILNNFENDLQYNRSSLLLYTQLGVINGSYIYI